MRQKWSIFLIITFSLLTIPVMGSIIKKLPVKPVEITYNDLVCSDQDQANIYEIISTMAEKGKLSFLFQQSYLREIGAQINHVHPLKFLAVILKEPYLKSCMAVIWDDYFKKKGFLDGLAPSLLREEEKGKLQLYLQDFANDIDMPHEHIKPYANVHDWENMVLFLLQS